LNESFFNYCIAEENWNYSFGCERLYAFGYIALVAVLFFR